MSKLTGPLFSLTARGTIGKALTYSQWRGIQYVRTRVVPANPQTTDQTEVRAVWATLCRLWNRMPALGREPWELAAVGNPFTDRNRFLGINVPLLRGQASMVNFEATPGVGAALPPLTAGSADGGAQVLNLTLTQPALPAGWTHLSATGIAFLNSDPAPVVTLTPVAAEDAITPFTLIALSMGAGGTFYWATWNVLQAPDGTTRCSPHLDGTQVIA